MRWLVDRRSRQLDASMRVPAAELHWWRHREPLQLGGQPEAIEPGHPDVGQTSLTSPLRSAVVSVNLVDLVVCLLGIELSENEVEFLLLALTTLPGLGGAHRIECCETGNLPCNRHKLGLPVFERVA